MVDSHVHHIGYHLTAFSQAYRPNTNGRAEAAVRVVQDTLRKMHTQSAINWVEALPRVLRIQHDTKDPVMGYSPYQALFGRHRALAALPFENPEVGEEPEDCFQRMSDMDVDIAQRLNEHHKKNRGNGECSATGQTGL